MKYHSRALAGTALGLFMAASTAGAAKLHPVADNIGDPAVGAPLVLAQADNETPAEKKARKAEKRARQEEKQAQGQEKAERERHGEKRSSAEEGGKAQRNARQAPAKDDTPAAKPARQKEGNSKDAGGRTAQGGDQGGDNEQAPKRTQRAESETKQPAMNRKAPEKARGEDSDRGKAHRRNDENDRGGADNGKAVQGKAPDGKAIEGKAGQPKPEEDRGASKSREKAGEADREKRPDDNARSDSDKASGKAAAEKAGQDSGHGKNVRREDETNEKGVKAGKNNPGRENAPTGEAAPKPGEKPADAAGKAGEKAQPDQADRDNAHDRDNARDRNGERDRNAEGRRPADNENARDRQRAGERGNAPRGDEADGGKGASSENGKAAEGGGNIELPKSLSGRRDRGERKGGEARNNDKGEFLPDSARGRHGQRQESRQGGGGGKAGPLPDSDAAAQRDFERPERIRSITAIEGKRIDRPERIHREHPRDVKVVKEVKNRTIVEINNQIFVRGSDRPRITRHARDVYYEDLPHNRIREVVVREDGSRVVTIRNEYGDVIRRSRIMPDHREVVLVYVDDRDLDRDRGHGWGDAGADLPPLVVDVPRDDYILEADNVRDPDRYYTFLEQPPVEPVKRLYSLGEVKRSARIRDIMPRIDLDTITFDFGSAEVGQDQADKLQAVADAIKRILDDNPAETFLIEGHTDAVGSDQANLVLSDERADSVASLLTSMFDIPSENLTTQGYGEEYLKVDTDEANRQNRRVTIRRITPLVAPVASAE